MRVGAAPSTKTKRRTTKHVLFGSRSPPRGHVTRRGLPLSFSRRRRSVPFGLFCSLPLLSGGNFFHFPLSSTPQLSDGQFQARRGSCHCACSVSDRALGRGSGCSRRCVGSAIRLHHEESIFGEGGSNFVVVDLRYGLSLTFV